MNKFFIEFILELITLGITALYFLKDHINKNVCDLDVELK